MFNLEQAIEIWKRQLAAGQSINPAAIDELESHLRDAIECKVRQGVGIELAFYKSVAELGESESLKGQFRAAEPFLPRRARTVRTMAILLIVGSAILSGNFFSPSTAPKIVGVLVSIVLFGALAAKYLAFVRWKNLEPDLSSFSPMALSALDLARTEAPLFGHDFVGTEHLLLGICGQIPDLLGRLGLKREEIREQIAKVVGTGAVRQNSSVVPFTPRAKQAMRLAAAEARGLRHLRTEPEHLFLGLLVEPSGVATRVLHELGVEIKSARESVLETLRRNGN